jgi:hypothetical protein
MLNMPPLRHRYTQFFVLLMLFSFTYMMANSIYPDILNFQDNLYKKDFLIEKAALLRIKLGDKVFPVVLLGNDGWMEYSVGGNIDEFQNVRSLGMGNKKNLVKELTKY